MTPSAARGLVEAIYWHPGLRWIIDRIHVCAPIRFTNLRRNEVKSTLSARSARTVMERGKGELYLCTSDDIQQRAALLLRDVRYVIEAHFDMTSQAAPGDNPGKFQDIVKRRIKKGQFYHQPCFGCREFPAHFHWCELPPARRMLLGRARSGLDPVGYGLYKSGGYPPPVLPRHPAGRGAGGARPGQRGGAGMILQALTQYYETLVQAGVHPAPAEPVRPPMHSLSPQTGRWSRLRPFRRSSSEGKRLCSPPRCSRSLLRSNAQ